MRSLTMSKTWSEHPEHNFMTMKFRDLLIGDTFDFIDDENILVANREGEPCIFKLPLGATGNYELEPLAVIRSDEILAPGSCAVINTENGLCEALICNNYAHRVTSHLLDSNAGYSTKSDKVLLRRWLDIPDGICVSKDTQWIAVSNHNTHAVLLYKN